MKVARFDWIIVVHLIWNILWFSFVNLTSPRFHCLLACCTFQAIESGILQSVKMCCILGRNSHMRATLFDGQLYGTVMVPHRFRKGTSWLQILPKHRLPPKPIAIVSINFLLLKKHRNVTLSSLLFSEFWDWKDHGYFRTALWRWNVS